MTTSTHDNGITFVFCNIRKGERVDAACDWIREQKPHVVLWQEMQACDLLHVQTRLEMHGYPAAKTSASGNDNVIFLHDDGLFAVTQEHPHSWAGWHAPANVSVKMRNADGQLSPRSLSLVSEHSCYWSASRRMDEANWYTTLAKDGWLAIAAGDWNGYAQGEGPTAQDWERVEDRAFFVNRTWLAEDGSRRTDDRGDRILTAAGFVDAARWAADRLGLTDLLHSTVDTSNQGNPDGPQHPHGVPAPHRDAQS
ncbi:hypothetical protein ACFWY6_32165 [Streptomyces sp. NPDC059037]|uniref:hypothetical protein n=1 Tax=Streptomyces sp. NPDC059037 TaxID=3346710 RepID=UPI0036B1EA2E